MNAHEITFRLRRAWHTKCCESLSHPNATPPPATEVAYVHVTQAILAQVVLCADCAASLRWELEQRERAA